MLAAIVGLSATEIGRKLIPHRHKSFACQERVDGLFVAISDLRTELGEKLCGY